MSLKRCECGRNIEYWGHCQTCEINELKQQLKDANECIGFVDDIIDDIEGFTQGCQMNKNSIAKRVANYKDKYKDER